MTPLEQRLTKLAEKMADDVGAKCSTSPRDKFDIGKISYIAGAAAMIPIIVKLADSLKFYSNKNYDRVCFLDHATCHESYGEDARQYLKELEDFINKQGE